MATIYRKAILDKLIEGFAALTHTDGTSKLFGDVKAMFVTFPTTKPVCEILPSGLNSVDDTANLFTFRQYNYTATIYDSIGTKDSETNAKVVIDRLSDIEDMVLRYLETLPGALEHSVTGVHINRQQVLNASWGIEEFTNGISAVLRIEFALHVEVDATTL